MNGKSLNGWKLLALAGLTTLGQNAFAQQWGMPAGAPAPRAAATGEVPPDTMQAIFREPMYPQTNQTANPYSQVVRTSGYGYLPPPTPTPATPPATEPAPPAPVKGGGLPSESRTATASLTTLKSYQIEQVVQPRETIEAPVDPSKIPMTNNLPGDANLLNGVCGHYDHGGWSWVFGLEQTFLVPGTEGVRADVTVVSPTNTFNANGAYNMEFGPRVWLGMQCCNWQVRGRFWAISGVEDTIDPLIVGTADRLGVANNTYVDAMTVDVEAIRLFCCSDDWNLYAGVGFRYGSLHDVANITVTQIDGQAIPAVVQVNAMAFAEMDGGGVTVPFGGFKPVHCFCCSTLDAFWNIRGSVIFGDITNVAQTSVMVIDPNALGTANRFDAASAQTSNELTIGEVQVGLRWRHQLRCAPACASMWIAFEYQWWNADGGVAFTDSVGVVNANGGQGTALSGPDTELNLIGFTLGASLNW